MSDTVSMTDLALAELRAERAEAEANELRRRLEAATSAMAPAVPTIITDAEAERVKAVEQARIAAAVRERQAEAERLTSERAARRAADGHRRLEDFKGQMHQRFLNNGASESDFQASWPELKRKWITEQATDPADALYARMTAGTRRV